MFTCLVEPVLNGLCILMVIDVVVFDEALCFCLAGFPTLLAYVPQPLTGIT